jgi:hypothetical protein
MPETLLVELSPTRARVEPGGAPAEAVVTLQNLGDVVEQYGVEVVGLDPLWYTVSANGDGIGLFPKDRDQVRLAFHPPIGSGVRAGTYRFEVHVRSRDGSQDKTAQGVLEVGGRPAVRVDLMPLRQTARGKGRFHLQATNTGTADGEIALEARDAEEACRFRFPKGDAVVVPAKGKLDLPFEIIPKRRPWFGAERTYDFTVTARSQNTRSLIQPFPGQFTNQPRIGSLGPFVRLSAWSAIALGAVLVALVFLSQLQSLSAEFIRRYCAVTGGITALQERWPCGDGSTGGGCHFGFFFREFSRADAELTGKCTSNEIADGFGNTRQYTSNGVLFWQKTTGTVFYFSNDKLYVFEDKQIRLLDSPEKH